MILRGLRFRQWLPAAAGLLVGLGLMLSLPVEAAQTSKQAAATQKAAKAKKSSASAQKQAAGAKKKTVAQKGDRKKGEAVAAKKSRKQLAQSSARDRKKLASANRSSRQHVAKASDKRNGRAATSTQVAKARADRSVIQVAQTPRVSAGERLGLRGADDPLDLSSSVALVVDQDTSEVLFSKNDRAVLPIASLTKLMTGLVIADAQLPMDESITITDDDAAVYRNSRLAVGTTLSRGEMMHLSLMSSENRAANALGRTFPGGRDEFVRRMNAKARELGMRDTRFVEPTGLSSDNQSSARDLATLVSVAYERPILRDLSTSPSYQLDLGRRTLQYNNSNRLVRNPEWEIGLQKTGYISEAGRCLVMQAKVAGRKVIMVFLDSAGKLARVQDAERVRRWVEAQSIQQHFVRPQG